MWRWLWLSSIVVILDQWTKKVIEEEFVLYETLPVTDFFNLILVYNKGAAFSFLADAGGWQRWFFLTLAVGISIYLVWWLLQLKKGQILLPFAIAMIIGGAIGNVIDRFLYGHVIDFLDFYINDWHWPAFNLADSAITLGVALFIWDAIFGKQVQKNMKNTFDYDTPNKDGYFGDYGGSFIPEQLQAIMDEITESYLEIRKDPGFIEELTDLYKHYVGRPSPIFHAKNLSEKYGTDIYLKREDLNHTGAHKINHCLGEALLAKKMGKKKIIAETGAGQHGVALATAAALVGLECDIYMGEVDIKKEHPNVVRMQILGATVIPATHGRKTLKEAVDAAFEGYVKDPVNQLYAIGSVVGPHPFPMMVRDFQSIVGNEAKVQFNEMTGSLPDNIVACVGGGSNAMGIFSAFLDDQEVALHGVEPSGRSLDEDGEHAATITKGEPGVMHGFKSYMLKGADGEPMEVYSVASGLDYPSVGPQHSYLKDIGRVNYAHINDKEAIDAFFELSRLEGIIPAIESSHAVAHALRMANEGEKGRILINLSGRGDKDIDFVVEQYGADYGVENKL